MQLDALLGETRTAGAMRVAAAARAHAWLLAPFAAALALRLGLATLVPVRPVWDGTIYVEGADALARGLGYVRGSMDPAHPENRTSFYPVGFPALLAALRLLRLGGALDLVAQCAAGAVAAALGGLLGARAGGLRAGRTAAWLVALWPGGILLSSSWLAEPLFTLFVASASLIVAHAPRGRTLRASALAGLALGLGAYVRPTAIPMAFALALGLAITSAESWRGRVRAAALHLGATAATLAVVLSPWAARNAVVLGGVVPVATNGGVNLLIGARGQGSFETLPAGLCAGLGEIARDRCFGRLALERIAADPAAWLARGVLKMTHTFGHESSPAQAWARATTAAGVRGEAHALWALAIDRAFWLPFLAAAIVGGVILWRRRPGERDARVKVALFAPILALAALHFVFLAGDRYHAPIVPLMAVLAALGVGAVPARAATRDLPE